VSLDRQSIEKRDFPVGRRGYDPEAVDAHLSALADEVADLKRSARRRTDTLASSASEQVRAIVEAAETSAADIQREAETDAREIRDEANREALATRDNATEQAREYLGNVSESTSSMQQRIDAMDTELSTLIDSLRTGTNRLGADLQLLEGNLGEVGEGVSPRPQFELEAEPEPDLPEPALTEAELAAESDEGDTEVVTGVLSESEAAAAAPEADADWYGAEDTEPELVDSSEGPDDAESARLIALNMALNGTPREEAAQYLSENFQLSDRESLLDEVYASVDG
jgi:DivIVA domain-containing protein